MKIEIIPYLTFSGNCREAMRFYQSCLGGDLHFQTIGDSRGTNKKTPQKIKDCILHASLVQEAIILMGTDLVSDAGLLQGNSVSLVLNCNSEGEIRKLYKQLSTGGVAKYPLANTLAGAIFGSCKDKYGHHWLLNYNKQYQGEQ